MKFFFILKAITECFFFFCISRHLPQIR